MGAPPEWSTEADSETEGGDHAGEARPLRANHRAQPEWAAPGERSVEADSEATETDRAGAARPARASLEAQPE